MKKLILLLLFIFYSCGGDSSVEEQDLTDLNLYEFLRGKVYESPSTASNDFWNVGTELDGKMYVQFSKKEDDWEGWKIFYKADNNNNNCELDWVFDDSYYLVNTINTPSKLRIDGVYGQFWVFTKTAGNKIEILYGGGGGSGNEQFNGEALKLEFLSLGLFNMLKCE
tara:strand:+ start:753 stop:1253 length:501 start_codon:yes stop_codon:yes gene_type:complete